METVYRSKIDLWLIGVLAAAASASVVSALAALSIHAPSAWAIAAVTVASGAGLPLWLLTTTRYTLVSGQLQVQCGPFKWRIAVVDITGVVPTRNPIASPALSLDRLRIDYGRGNSLMISPRDKDQFSRDLEAMRDGPP